MCSGVIQERCRDVSLLWQEQKDSESLQFPE